MNFCQCVKIIKLYLKAGVPVFLHGSPGSGKSALFKEIDPHRIDIRVGQLDPVDLRGLPRVVGKRTVYSSPEFFPDEGTKAQILLLDEINTAPPSMQAALYQLILDRRIGEYKLPSTVTPVAAGNLQGDGAVVNKVSSALNNRFAHLTLDVDKDSWMNWGLNNQIHPHVLGFINFRPGALFQFDLKSKAFAHPTPRSWEMASKVIKQNPDDVFSATSGIIGEGAASELAAFVKSAGILPKSYDDLLKNINKFKMPSSDPSAMYALCGLISASATEKNFGVVMEKIVSKFPPEFGILCLKDCIKRLDKGKLFDLPAVVAFAADKVSLI